MNKRLKTAVLACVSAWLIVATVILAQTRNGIGIEFVKIAPGEFMMGCSPGDTQCNPDESPRHRVQITKGFEIGKYEVTQKQWVAVMQSNPSGNKGDNLPVETVSKIEAQDFIAKLNAMNDGYRYRLPTEAEWEYAARAGSDSANAGALGDVAWYAGNSEDETHAVGQKRPNKWGLYDVQGNVREWVSDFYSSVYYSNSPAIDPTGPMPCPAGGNPVSTFNPARGGRGGPGPGGQGGPPGVRGGPGGPQRGNPPPPAPPPPPPPPFPVGGTQQEQIDALRRQVEQLQQQLQQLRNDFQAGPLRGGPGGPGGAVSGPFACVGTDNAGNPQLVDTLDGLPTGLPVVRGGGWDQRDSFQRVSARYSYYGPTLRVSDIGFRVVRVPAGQP